MPIDLVKFKRHHGAVAADGEICFKSAQITTPSVDRKERLVQGLVSVASPDMDEEVVMPSGLDRWYFPDKVAAVYWNHDYDQMPVCKCVNMAVRKNGAELFATTYIMPSAFGDDLLTAIEKGVINGFSVGYKPIDRGPPTVEEKKLYGEHKVITRKGVLIEYSITPMPTCAGALVEMVSKSEIHRSSAIQFGLPEVSAPVVPTKRVFIMAGGRLWSKA